jgi:nucleoside-diphosphate-sugar epimerase
VSQSRTQEDTAINVLVTGATGTLGYNVARLLTADQRYRLFLPVRRPLALLSELGPNIEVIETDVRMAGGLPALFGRAKPHLIVHCAASGLRPPRLSWFDLVSFNVESTLRLFEAYCLSSEAHHFIYVSSGLAYTEEGRPLREDDQIGTRHPYGASKAAADLLLQAAAIEFGRRLTIVRPFAFTGRQDAPPRVFPELLLAAAVGKTFSMTSGDQVRDFCAVEDIARGIVCCIERTSPTLIETFNLGSGEAKTLRQSVESVSSELGLDVDLHFGSMPRPPHDPTHLVADIQLATRELGWKPEISIPYAVWELAQEITPGLRLKKPEKLRKS